MTNPTINKEVIITNEHQPEIYTISQINKKQDKVKLNWFGEPYINAQYCDKNGWYPISILSDIKEVEPSKAVNLLENNSKNSLLKADCLNNDEELEEAFKQIKENLSILIHKPILSQPLLDLEFRKDALIKICQVIYENAEPFMQDKLPFIYYPFCSAVKDFKYHTKQIFSMLTNKIKYGVMVKNTNVWNMCDYLKESNIKLLNIFITKSAKYSNHLDLERDTKLIEEAKQAFMTFEEWLLDNYKVKGKTLKECGLDVDNAEFFVLMTTDVDEWKALYEEYREFRKERFLLLEEVMDKMWW